MGKDRNRLYEKEQFNIISVYIHIENIFEIDYR